MILGIDIGTSNSLAAVYRDGRVELIPDSTGSTSIPSVVSIDQDGMVYTGEVAKERLITHPKETAAMFKRELGTKKEYLLSGNSYTAEKLFAILLESMKRMAEKHLGEKIKEAVISVPAFFLNPQRQAVLRAAKLAGLSVRQIINEPTAAAVAYNIADNPSESGQEKIIMVLDLGGGTFDISIMEATSDVMEVVAVCGDNQLGGRDFTDRMIELFLQKCGLGEVTDAQDKEKLWKSAERAKKVLSEQGEATVSCVLGEQYYECHVTEAEYTVSCQSLLEKMRKLVLRTVAESQYQSHEIDDIIMIGGGTRLSVVKKMIEKISGKQVDYKINPDEAVVCGAAIRGALYEKDQNLKDIVMTDICPYHICTAEYSMSQYDFVCQYHVLIPKNHVVPACITFHQQMKPGDYSYVLYQTEDELGTGATKLVRIEYVVPQCEEQKTETIKRIIFDSHGIIHYEVYFPCIDRTYTTSFSETETVDDEESRKELDRLRYTSEMDQNTKNTLLLSKAESLYCECLGEDRKKIGNMIAQLEEALKSGKKTLIAKAEKELNDMIERMEMI